MNILKIVVVFWAFILVGCGRDGYIERTEIKINDIHGDEFILACPIIDPKIYNFIEGDCVVYKSSD